MDSAGQYAASFVDSAGSTLSPQLSSQMDWTVSVDSAVRTLSPLLTPPDRTLTPETPTADSVGNPLSPLSVPSVIDSAGSTLSPLQSRQVDGDCHC